MTYQTESNAVLCYMKGTCLDFETRHKLKVGFRHQFESRVPLYGKRLLEIVQWIHNQDTLAEVVTLHMMTEELIRYHPQILCHRLLCTYLVPLLLFHKDAPFKLGTHFLSLLLLAHRSLEQHDRLLSQNWASMCSDRLFTEEDAVDVLLQGSVMNIFCKHGHIRFLDELLLMYAKEATQAACEKGLRMQKIVEWWLDFHREDKIDRDVMVRWWLSGLYPKLVQDVDYWYRRLRYSGPDLDYFYYHHLSVHPVFAPLLQRVLDNDGWVAEGGFKLGSLACRRDSAIHAMDRDDLTLLPLLVSFAFLHDTKLRSNAVRKTLVALQDKAVDREKKRVLCETLEAMRTQERFAKIQHDLVFAKGDALYRYLLRQRLMSVPWYGVSTAQLLCPGVFSRQNVPQEVLRYIFSFL